MQVDFNNLRQLYPVHTFLGDASPQRSNSSSVWTVSTLIAVLTTAVGFPCCSCCCSPPAPRRLHQPRSDTAPEKEPGLTGRCWSSDGAAGAKA